MDPSIYVRKERIVKTVDSSRRTCSKERENGSIGRKDHGHRFMEFARHHLHRLFAEGKDNHAAVLCWFIGLIRGWIDEKTVPFGEEKIALSPWQRASSPAHPQLPQQNWSNYANCCLIHPILQIWPHGISFCSKTWKNGLVVSDSRQTRKSSPQQRPI